MQLNLIFAAILCVGLAVAKPHSAEAAWFSRGVTAPQKHFGFNIGDDFCLANFQQMSAYWSKLDQESSRLRVVTIGASEEGRPMLMAIVTSPANHRRLETFRQTSQRLALAEGLSEKDARRLADNGRAVVWIDGGLHATETVATQQLTETIYQLVSRSDAETKRILDDVIVLAVLANPDGMDLVSDWYMREEDVAKRTYSTLPRLYQKYIGHDNNRDFYAVTQAETRAMNRVMYQEWFPQIVYNHHQPGPRGTILFCPPFRDPFNYNVDPMVMSGIDAVGASMMNRFLQEGKPGATVRSGARYSTWWNGGLRTTTYFHNMIGLLTETIGHPTPMMIPYVPELQLPRGDYLAPIAPQRWHFRQSIDYSVTANYAVLDYASRHRAQLLHNFYVMGRNAIERGRRDHWTITPQRVAAAQTAAKDESKTNRVAKPFEVFFRAPEQRDPRGYILPADQPDFLTATKFIRALMDCGVRVDRATSSFEVGGRRYPAGSYVVQTAQAFRAHILDMFEPQDHPNDFAYPGAPPTAPYDMAGWTFAFQMGVQFDRLLESFDGPFEAIKQLSPPVGQVLDEAGAIGYFLDPRVNDAFLTMNRLIAAGQPVLRVPHAVEVRGQTIPAGGFYLPARSETKGILRQLAQEIGVNFIGTPNPPGDGVYALQPLRIGLWDRYGGSMPSGWTRWILERFEFPFQLVFPPELDAGHLREKFDVLLFVDGAIPAASTPVSSPQPPPVAEGEGGCEAPPASAAAKPVDPRELALPEEYRGRRGSITAKQTIPQLREFLEQGGTILTIGSSTRLAAHLELPVTDHLSEIGEDGKTKSLPREKFYVPGSVLQVRVDNTHPLAYGMGEIADVMFVRSPVFRLETESPVEGIRRVAWFDHAEPLRSGWAWGQEYLQNGTAVVEARVGSGRLVMFGPEIAFRAQPHGTFKFLFNGLVSEPPRAESSLPLATEEE